MGGNRSGGIAQDLTQGSVAKTLIRFSMPFMLSTLLQTLYSTTDTIVVGQYLGSAGLSAVSNGSQVMQLLYLLGIGFASASQVLVAQSKGANDLNNIKKIVTTLFYLVTMISLVIGGLCCIFSKQILDILGTPQEAYESARAYIVICGGGILFTGYFNMFSAVLRGAGDSRHPLIFVLIASAMNVVLDIVFIACFHWGVAGAAWATIIGQACSVLFSFVFLHRHAKEIGFAFSLRREFYSKPLAKQMVHLGVPLAIQTGAVHFSFLFVSHMVNALGVAASAAFGVAQKLRSLPGIITQGLSLGANSMIGQNLGAQKQDRVQSTVRWGIAVCTCICAVFSLAFAFFPKQSFQLFTQDETVLAYAGMCMFTILIEMPSRCVMPPCGALINAQGFVSFSMAVGLVDAFLGRIFLCWLLGSYFQMGAFGIFLGYTLSTYLTAIPTFLYYITGIWKKRRLLIQTAPAR